MALEKTIYGDKKIASTDIKGMDEVVYGQNNPGLEIARDLSEMSGEDYNSILEKMVKHYSDDKFENESENNSVYTENIKESSLTGKLKKAFTYMKDTSVTQGAKDLGEFVKTNYNQTVDDVKSSYSKLNDAMLYMGVKVTEGYQGAMNKISGAMDNMNYGSLKKLGSDYLGTDRFGELMKTGYDKVKEFTKNGIFNKKAARKSLKKGKFTLIELLVVVAIIGILAAMLLPVLGKARASARESTMLTNMKQFNLAQIQYRDSDDTKQFLWNRMVGPKIGVDYGPLKNEGFIEDLMEDKFRKLKLSEDPMIQTMFIPNDADFHSNEKGLLYFNFKSKESNGTSVMDLATFNDKFGYDVPEDTEYAVVGVGKDGFLDTDDPKKDFVMIKRRDNENNERWKGE